MLPDDGPAVIDNGDQIPDDEHGQHNTDRLPGRKSQRHDDNDHHAQRRDSRLREADEQT